MAGWWRRLWAAAAAAAALLPSMAACSPEKAMEAVLAAANPEFPVLKAHYPEQYAQLVSTIRDAAGKPDAAIRVQQVATPLIANLVVQHRKQVDDANAKAMLELTAEEAAVLRPLHPDACAELLSGRAPSIDLASLFNADLRKHDQRVTADMLEQVAVHPAPPPQPLTLDDERKLALGAAARLTPQERAIAVPLMQHGGQPSTLAEQGAVCAFSLASVQQALSQPGVPRRLLGSG